MRTIQREIVSALIFSKDGKLFQGKKNISLTPPSQKLFTRPGYV